MLERVCTGPGRTKGRSETDQGCPQGPRAPTKPAFHRVQRQRAMISEKKTCASVTNSAHGTNGHGITAASEPLAAHPFSAAGATDSQSDHFRRRNQTFSGVTQPATLASNSPNSGPDPQGHAGQSHWYGATPGLKGLTAV